MLPDGFLVCAETGCQSAFKPRGPNHQYCRGCSATRDLERKRKWASNNPQPFDDRKRAQATKRRDGIRQRGAEINAREPSRRGVRPGLAWQIEIDVPFSYDGSKNHVWTMSGTHTYSRRESIEYRATIADSIALAIRSAGQHVAHNRLWVGLFVQMPNNRGDAHNMVDLVMDAVEDATGLDDRYYSLSGVDWEIRKTDPRMFVSVGQESFDDIKICSACGRFLPHDQFTRNRSSKDGIGRNCRECRAGRPSRSVKS